MIGARVKMLLGSRKDELGDGGGFTAGLMRYPYLKK